MEEKNKVEEKKLKAKPGMGMLILGIVLILISAPLIFAGAGNGFLAQSIVISVILILAAVVVFCGLKILQPNEALVLTLFGKYYGTLYHEGFYWVNPFCEAVNPTAVSKMPEKPKSNTLSSGDISLEGIPHTSKKVSLKKMTLNNKKQKVNDAMGNPVEIGIIVIWCVKNATQAVLNVENYMEYLSIQCDAVTRNAARNYPYDTNDESDEKTLRGSSQEIASIMQKELQEKVKDAGIEIMDVRITHLAYAPEIASAMLQRQQASAIIDARQKIVEGAVGMVEMALNQLNENQIVDLDEERKAAMVSNLLVVLCGNKDAQPIVNSGTIY